MRIAVLLAVAACSKHAATFHGSTWEADVPVDWHAGTHPLADALRSLADGTPAHADVQTLVDDHDQAIIVAEFTVGESAKDLAPQRGAIAAKFAAFAENLVHTPSLTDERCTRMFERLQLPVLNGRKLDLGGPEGCEGTSADGARRVALVEVELQTVIVMCSAAAGRACDTVLRSLRPRRVT
jgi:hypothetical protein